MKHAAAVKTSINKSPSDKAVKKQGFRRTNDSS